MGIPRLEPLEKTPPGLSARHHQESAGQGLTRGLRQNKVLGSRMILAESPYLSRRALTLHVVRMLLELELELIQSHIFACHFLEWGSAPNLAPGCFVALGCRDGYHQKPFRSVLPLGELDTISQPPHWLMFSKILHYISLFPAPCASPSGCWGAHIGLLATSSPCCHRR